MKKTAKRTSKKTVSLLLVLIGAALATYLIVWFTHKQPNQTTNISQSSPTPGPGYVNYNPPSYQDTHASDQRKDSAPPTTSTPQSNSPTAKQAVTPVIVDASQYNSQVEVRSYVPGVVESSGQCTITLTSDTLTVTRKVVATADATTTRCQNVDIDRSEFAKAGIWSTTVTYESSTHKGTSDPAKTNIQ